MGTRKDPATGRCGSLPRDDTGYRVLDAAAASRDDEGALVFLESTSKAPERWQITLRRVDRFGVVQGEPVELAAQTGSSPGSVTIATDGKRYVTCWSLAGQVTCVSVAPDHGARAEPAFEVPGDVPVLVYGSGTWVLASNVGSEQEAKVEVRQLDDDFRPLGELKTLPGPAGAYWSRPASLAARPSGFALVTGNPQMVYPLGARLEPSGAPVSLGKSPWSHASIAATETRIAVSLAVPYGAMLFQIGPHGIDKTTPMDGGGKLGLPVHLRASGSSLYATWHDTEWHDEVVDAAFASLNREASAGGGRVALATLEVHGNKLAAITDGRGGARIVRIP